MVRKVEWSKWHRTPRGWVRIPPPACPRGHPWGMTGAARPVERFVTCTCTPDRHHTLWVCRACGMHAAEGCTDPAQWHGHTIAAGLPADRRGVV